MITEPAHPVPTRSRTLDRWPFLRAGPPVPTCMACFLREAGRVLRAGVS